MGECCEINGGYICHFKSHLTITSRFSGTGCSRYAPLSAALEPSPAFLFFVSLRPLLRSFPVLVPFSDADSFSCSFFVPCSCLILWRRVVGLFFIVLFRIFSCSDADSFSCSFFVPYTCSILWRRVVGPIFLVLVRIFWRRFLFLFFLLLVRSLTQVLLVIYSCSIRSFGVDSKVPQIGRDCEVLEGFRWRWRRGWFLMGTRSGQPRSVWSGPGVHRIPPMRETDGGDAPQRQDQATPRSAARGVAVGAHHPWDFQIHFHRLIIKHVSIWFSFPFSRSCFGYPALPPCPALPFDLFLVNYSLSRRVV